MRHNIARLSIAIGLFLCTSAASATTYTYQGNSLDWSCFGTCTDITDLGSFHSTVSAEVVFNFDTSNTSGTFVSGISSEINSATFSGGTPPKLYMDGGLFGSYPPAITALGALSASFTLHSGMITAWDLEATSGGGTVSISASSSAGGDGIQITICEMQADCSQYSATANGAEWSGPMNDAFAPAVPEPSTWAMLLIGFAAIGLARYRRSTV